MHVLDNQKEAERDAAKRILSLVISAERPFMWKEIQSCFCIEIEAEIADPDFYLPMTCKQLCGSLVEVEQNANSTAGSDDIVDLVHDTARM